MSRLNRLVLVAMPRAMALGLAVLSARAQSSSAFEPGPPVRQRSVADIVKQAMVV